MYRHLNEGYVHKFFGVIEIFCVKTIAFILHLLYNNRVNHLLKMVGGYVTEIVMI